MQTPRPQIRAAIETIFGVKATEGSRFSHCFDRFPMLNPISICQLSILWSAGIFQGETFWNPLNGGFQDALVDVWFGSIASREDFGESDWSLCCLYLDILNHVEEQYQIIAYNCPVTNFFSVTFLQGWIDFDRGILGSLGSLARSRSKHSQCRVFVWGVDRLKDASYELIASIWMVIVR